MPVTCDHKKPRLLVIEDDEFVASGIQRSLANHWESVTLASSSDKGIELLREGNYDIVLSDWDCPDSAGGHRVARATNLPVVILTGRMSVNCPEAIAVVDKPIGMADLQEILVDALERRRT